MSLRRIFPLQGDYKGRNPTSDYESWKPSMALEEPYTVETLMAAVCACRIRAFDSGPLPATSEILGRFSGPIAMDAESHTPFWNPADAVVDSEGFVKVPCQLLGRYYELEQQHWKWMSKGKSFGKL
jgi:hypothetical protein